ncbi:hypothetical protein HHI36_004578 [Cryptolaemus montrouzieri]
MASSEAKTLVSKITQRDPDKFLGCINMCRNLGYGDNEILEYPGLLNGPPMVLEQHFMSLEEGGFEKITPHILLKYRKYFSKKICTLKEDKLVPEHINVAESFGHYFDPHPEDGVIDYKQFKDEERWRDVHYKLLKMYLKWRLKASTEEIDVLFRTHKMVQNKCIRYLCENIKLALDIGLPLKRIIRSGYILHSYPKYTKEVLRDFANIAGGDLKQAMYRSPKLCMVSPKNYAKIYGILKEHEIPDEAIRNKLSIFQLSPQTVKHRLEEIDKMPELKVLKFHKQFLRLVLYHHRAKSRLCFMEELQMKCVPLRILSQQTSIDMHIRDSRDINDCKEVMLFIKNLLKIDPKHFEKSLRRHPYHLAVPLPQIEDTYRYLHKIKFKNEAICKASSILLYPKEKIKEALLAVRKNSLIGKVHVSQAQRLNLALYNLEKKHHFTGDGIWPELSTECETELKTKE